MAVNKLPPIKTLFADSWKTLKKSALHLLVLYVISCALFAGLAIAGLIITAPLGVFSVFNAIQNNGITPAFFTSMGVLGVVLLVLLCVGIVIGAMIQASMLLVVANYQTKPSYRKTLRQGLSLAWPLILAGLITGFITTGGFLLFVIPGIIFVLAFMFVNMEIVLNKQSVTSALRRSMGIVFSNFWGILSRVLLFGIIAIVITIIPQALAGGTRNVGISGLFGILSMIINILIGWYGLAYSITLYKQASKNYTGSGSGSKLLWPVIISIAGWILGIIFIVSITALVFSMVNNAVMKKGANSSQFSKELQKMLENPSEENINNIINLLPTDSPERAKLMKEIKSSVMN